VTFRSSIFIFSDVVMVFLTLHEGCQKTIHFLLFLLEDLHVMNVSQYIVIGRYNHAGRIFFIGGLTNSREQQGGVVYNVPVRRNVEELSLYPRLLDWLFYHSSRPQKKPLYFIPSRLNPFSL
jgi:hypothetical protein